MVSIDWTKYPLTKDDWEYFATLNRGERCKYLKEHGLQYKDVPKCSKCWHVFFNCKCGDKEFAKKKQNWLNEMSKSFEEKLKFSEAVVDRVLNKAKKFNLKIYLAYSGGFDSECCLQLFKEGIKEGLIQVIVGNTLTELPDTRIRWKEAEKEFDVKFIYATPECGVSFKSNAIKYGLPLFPRNSGIESKRIPTKKCCINLKEKPQKKLMKDVDGVILGLHNEPKSQGRKWVIRNKGECYINAKGKWIIYPIAYWTTEDEWKYQQLLGFNYNGIYDKTNCNKKGFYKLSNGKMYQIRSGCGFCPQGIHEGYLEWLQEYYPKWYNALVNVYNKIALERKNGMDFNKVLVIKKINPLPHL